MNSEAKYWYLHNHELFDEMSRKEVIEMAYKSHFYTGRKGEVINLTHPEDRVFTIKAGILKLVEIDKKGEEQLIDILRVGDLFGQFTLNHQDNSQYAVVLSNQITFCSFLASDLELTMRQNPALGIRYTKLIGLRLRKLENQYKNLMFKDVRTRFRLFLKEWVEKDAKPNRPFVVNNYLSHRDISRLICSNRQTITELFNEFRLAGMIHYDRNEITILDSTLLDV